MSMTCSSRTAAAARASRAKRARAVPEVREDLLALDEALTKLASTDPQAAQLVQLRYFAGLSIPDAAQALGVSSRTADRLWAFARAWLLREIGGDVPGDQNS